VYVCCIGADVPAYYYETSNNLLSFPILATHFPLKISRSQFETKKDRSRLGTLLSVSSRSSVLDRKETQKRLIRDPNETDLFATSVTMHAAIEIIATQYYNNSATSIVIIL
jgi:hypothetical protein